MGKTWVNRSALRKRTKRASIQRHDARRLGVEAPVQVRVAPCGVCGRELIIVGERIHAFRGEWCASADGMHRPCFDRAPNVAM